MVRTRIDSVEFVKIWQRETSFDNVVASLKLRDRRVNAGRAAWRASKMRTRGIPLQYFREPKNNTTQLTRELTALAESYNP